jgi:signal transduction histidine kinase
MFLTTMSHEFRTPLTAILGYTDLLQRQAQVSGDATTIADLQNIETAGKHLLMLITDVLDLAKIEAGRTEITPEQIDLADFIADLATIVEPLAIQQANTLTIEWIDPPTTLWADRTRLQQILLNLLSNACKFTSAGAITLRIRASDCSMVGPADMAPGVEAVVFEIVDTGIGIADGQIERLFEAFTQASEQRVHNQPGTGLGLTISRHLCRMMGGDISATSQPGRGSVFTVWMPLREQVAA